MKGTIRSWTKSTIKKKLLISFSFLICLMVILSYFPLYYTSTAINQYNGMLQELLFLNNLSQKVSQTADLLERYLFDRSPQALSQYEQNKKQLLTEKEQVHPLLEEQESRLLQRNIIHMIESFLQEADRAIELSLDRDQAYYEHYTEAKKISGFIEDQFKKFISLQLTNSQAVYRQFESQVQVLRRLTNTIIISVALFSITFGIWFANGISRPVTRLVSAAEEISRGNFDLEKIEVRANDEVSILAGAFNNMTENIRRLIGEISRKADLEAKLQEEEMKNLQMSNLLKEAEVKALQSQIKPHFLFNTLNVIAKTAMLEGAEKTCVLIESLAHLFRYNLGKIDKAVPLGEALSTVKEYIRIQQARFGDRVLFNVEADDEALLVPIPYMSLQPLVENAFIHGIEDSETGGEINIIVRKTGDMVQVRIVDNGAGIPPDRLAKIFEEDGGEKPVSGHSTGLGLKNVLRRLQLFYGRDDVMNIQSQAGKGTEVTLTLPAREG